MSIDTILDRAGGLMSDAVDLRRALHRNPEVGLHLPGTRALVLEALAGLPLEITEHESTSGVVAVLRGAKPGPTVLLRGDMDGLPMSEDTGVEFASVTGDTMHACGHDLHTAMLVGAARLLSEMRGDLAGSVVFMFQPGEEGYHGARYMLEEGMLDASGDQPDLAFAIHVTTIVDSGTIAVRSGPMMASADQIEIVIHGAGGHASRPDSAVDPVTIGAEVILALQTAVTRNVSVFDPAVCTITTMDAGTAHNIIPGRVRLHGTMRALSAETREKLRSVIPRVAEGIAAAHGATAEVSIENGYPVTVNDSQATAEMMLVAQELVGDGKVMALPTPSMGAEDFAYVLQQVPGAMFYLGACPPGKDPDTAPHNHSNLVEFDEDAMQTGIALYAAIALEHLQ